tara:strand:+ start:96 stop:1388 length:1293 start_codon:yes stop_codon:yes gene_type:complete
MELDALFALADEARTAVRRETGDDCLGDDDDASSMFVNPPCRIRTGRAFYTTDERGDTHVCFGLQCPHVCLDKEHNWVCSVSGRVVGIECSRDQDPSWTGRSTGSANPDDTAGTPVGGWTKRRDMFAASVAAYRNAHTMSDAEIAPLPSAVSLSGGVAVKRGALCVDEVPDPTVAPKRPRSSRKENWSREAIDKMASEAVGIIDKLFIVHHPVKTAEPPLDPRLQNPEFVKLGALRKYVKQCAEGAAALNLDVISNVLVHANEFVRAQRAAAAKRLANAANSATGNKGDRRLAVYSGQVRNLLSQLIVSLWRAACLTKHFKASKKGSDSFRPFVAGILYSLKRGLYLPDGTCIIPVLKELAAHLPALRSASSTPAAKQLQSSSHKGICSIQRALASIAEMHPHDALPARTLLNDASRQGAFLREVVSRNS